MTRRAVLIASQTYGLQGCDADAALMADVLDRRGFTDVVSLTGSAATRQAIFEALDRLRAAIVPGDAVVVYYSGHGGRVVRPDAEARRAAGRSPHFQFVVPVDIDASVDGDFRGILSEELTVAQARLTQAFLVQRSPANVTTILDCCHSAYLARDVEAFPKAVDLTSRMFPLLGILERAGTAAGAGGLMTNPDAVRLVACQPEQSAFEMISARGGRRGVFTDCLATVVGALHDEQVSWVTVADLVRRAVRARSPQQRPDVEGPAERGMFSAETLSAGWVLPVASGRRGPYVEGAELLGLAVGDELAVTVPGTPEPLGSAVVAAIVDGQAALRLDLGGRPMPDTAVVVPRRYSLPGAPVYVSDPSAAIGSAVASSGRLRRVETPSEAFATVHCGAGTLVVGDGAGARWRVTDFPDDELGRSAVVQLLEDLAVGRRLLDLPNGAGASALPADVTVTLASRHGAAFTTLAPHGSRLQAGTRIQVTVRNLASQERFFWMFDVGVSGRCTLITASSGTLVGPAGSADDALAVWDSDGEVLSWPADVPTEGAGSPGTTTDPARPESFVVVVADRRCDLRALASVTRGEQRPISALDAVLGEARAGVRSADSSGLRYRLEEISFLLSP